MEFSISIPIIYNKGEKGFINIVLNSGSRGLAKICVIV